MMFRATVALPESPVDFHLKFLWGSSAIVKVKEGKPDMQNGWIVLGAEVQ